MLIFAIFLTLSQLLIVYLIFRKELHDNIQKEEANDLLLLRLNSLKHEAELIQQDIKTTRILRHDLRHHYRMLYALLNDNNTKAALNHITKQEETIAGMRSESIKKGAVKKREIVFSTAPFLMLIFNFSRNQPKKAHKTPFPIKHEFLQLMRLF